MTTEPTISNKHALSSALGAVGFVLPITCIIAYSTYFKPGGTFGYHGVLAVSVGLFWFLLFLFYLGLGFKKNSSLKFALIVQSAVSLCFSSTIAYIAMQHEGINTAATVFFTLFFLLALSFGLGTWFWSLSK